jgi:lysophospholipase L1-like esterase
VFLAVCLAFGSSEALLRLYRGAAVQPTGTYEVSFTSRIGRPISSLSGPLRLRIAPFTVYENLPRQQTEFFSINGRGFRGTRLRQPPGYPRIVVVGGSAAFGIGLDRDDDAFAAILESLLPGSEVINAGVTGFGSGQELAFLATQLLDVKPELVVAFDGWNDLFDAGCNYFGKPIRDARDLGFNGNFVSIEQQLIEHHEESRGVPGALRRLCRALVGSSEVLGLVAGAWQRLRPEPASKKPSRRAVQGPALDDLVFKAYVRNVERMAVLCRGFGIRFLAAVQPEVGQRRRRTAAEQKILDDWDPAVYDYAQDFPPRYFRFVRRVVRRLNRLGVATLDISADPRFAEAPAPLFLDTVHLNRAGNEVVAQILLDWVRSAPADSEAVE